MTENTQNNNKLIIAGHTSEKALELLETLNQSPAGAVIYKQVENVLHESDHAFERVIRGYARISLRLLNAIRHQLPKDSLLYLELKLIQKRLSPPISIVELISLNSYLKSAVKIVADVSEPNEGLLREALSPFLDDDSDIEEKPDTSHTVPLEGGGQRHKPAPDYPPVRETSTETVTKQHVDSLYRQRLNRQHNDMLELHAKLAEKVGGVSDKMVEFGVLLESSLIKLKRTTNKSDIEALQRQLIEDVQGYLGGQGALRSRLHETQSLLEIVDSDSRKLTEELDQVRVLSLTDELTGLSNRRAFLRRLDDEIDRAQRDKTPLTVALIDLDHFKEVNDKYGHPVGDEMLRTYAKDILSIFRRYDMVARYGGEEFAVLLPNTEKEGAVRAFNKIRKKTRETFFINAGDAILVSTFSAGLAIYNPGESLDSLIERADKALFKAKRAGRDCIEFDYELPDKVNIINPAFK